jgi:C1A family cysteine protease
MTSQDQSALPIRSNRRLGWRRSHPDIRDRKFAAHPSVIPELPPKFDLLDRCPPIQDQLTLGSCVGHGTSFAVQMARRHQGATPDFTPSRLFIYYGARVIEGTSAQDCGCEIRDAFKVVANLGAPPEDDWPYDISRYADQPTDQAFTDAKLDVAVQYMSVPQELTAIKAAIYQGLPVVMGFTVYESFQSNEVARTGVMPIPQPSERVEGGHCVAWVGWDDDSKMFLTRNHWGTAWGQKGYFEMPYTIALDPDMSSDFWCLQKINDPD